MAQTIAHRPEAPVMGQMLVHDDMASATTHQPKTTNVCPLPQHCLFTVRSTKEARPSIGLALLVSIQRVLVFPEPGCPTGDGPGRQRAQYEDQSDNVILGFTHLAHPLPERLPLFYAVRLSLSTAQTRQRPERAGARSAPCSPPTQRRLFTAWFTKEARPTTGLALLVSTRRFTSP
jgi:hypothetical protein